jgi:hypothetical protein
MPRAAALTLIAALALVLPAPASPHGPGGPGGVPHAVVGPNQPSEAIDAVERVHVVVMTHLDVGFTDLAVPVINTYFQRYFPDVLTYARAVADSRDPNLRAFGYVFTSHPWLLSLYLDCPGELVPGLACPTDTEAEAVRSAIRDGVITWQGNAFNLQASLMDPSLFEASLRMAHDLDRAFGKPPKRTVSLRDVPGSTRAVLPAMRRAGYDALSIGANGAVVAAAVSNAFLWQEGPDDPGTIGLLHPGGYGGVKIQDCIVVPGLADALCVWVTGDNSGPPNTSAVFQVYRIVSRQFPRAQVFASTFDAFVDRLAPVRDRLPVVTQEMGDTWIGGPPADPWKIAAFRLMSRARAGCLESGRCAPDDPALRNFERFLLKAPEHTAGLSSTPAMQPFSGDWSNSRFEAVRDQQPFQDVEASWDEQREFLEWGLQALGAEGASDAARELAARIRAELPVLRPQGPPSTDGYEPVDDPAGPFACGMLEIGFDPEQGAISHLERAGAGRPKEERWATAFGGALHLEGGDPEGADPEAAEQDARRALDEVLRRQDLTLPLPPEAPTDEALETVLLEEGEHPLALFGYRTYDSLDFWLYIRQYAWVWPLPIDALSLAAFEKPGVQSAHPRSRWWYPESATVLRRTEAPGCDFLVELTMPEAAHLRYGAPATLWLRVEVPPERAEAHLDLVWLDKTTTRLPESLWMIFRPRAADPRGWRLHVLDQELDPTETLVNGSRHLAAVWDGVSYRGPDGALAIDTVDASVVAPGEPSLVDFDNFPVDPRQGMWFNLSNNVWNTNWPLWYPWRDDDENARFRFVLRLGEE